MYNVAIYDKDLEFIGGALANEMKTIKDLIAFEKSHHEAIVVDVVDMTTRTHIYNNCIW